jgi:hypothetical protein
MSAALERVIAEQQQEIDIIRRYRQVDAEHWTKANKRYEDLAQAAFMVLDSTSPEAHFYLKTLLIQQGWCITCEAQPCECGGQYD